MNDYQPYFLAYLLHTDADPGDVTGYILWISSKWREWKEMNGLDRWWRPNEKQREQFEQWLFEAVGDAVLREGKGMTEYCPRCDGELTEMPTNHYAKKIKVCKRCEKEDWKRLLNIPDESTVYGNDCRDGKCEM